jgi:ATPase subunit of ABC transporter with duplicated ATPase domains
MLGDFQGALVFVSHDREFMDGLCNQVLEVSDGGIRRYEGNYSAWRAVKAAEDDARGVRKDQAKAQAKADAKVVAQAASKAAEKAASKSGPASAGPSPANTKKTAGGKVRNPYLFEKLEARIIALETELSTLQAALVSEDVYRNPTKMRDAQMRIAEVERDLADANHEWENWA